MEGHPDELPASAPDAGREMTVPKYDPEIQISHRNISHASLGYSHLPAGLTPLIALI